MLKHRPGLHKDVSAIFNGVSLPKNDGTEQPSAAPAPANRDYGAPKPPASELPAQKPPAPSHMTPTKPKPAQVPLQSPPKAAPVKQPKADNSMKAAWQIRCQRTLEQIKSRLFTTKQGAVTTKQKVMAILIPVLFVILIFVFIRAFSTPSQKVAGPGTSVPVVNVAGNDSKVDWQVPNPYPTTLRDPMQFNSAGNHAGTGVGGLVVKGIIYSKDNPSAVIGDQIVHQGDRILDVVITKINENSVEFEANSKKWKQTVQR
jgi:hypothetical protein